MDLSGFCEFCYTFERIENAQKEETITRLADNDMGEAAFLCE